MYESTLEFEFFHNPLVQPLWQFTNRMIQHMRLPKMATTIDEALLIIYDLGGTSNIEHIININLIFLTLKTIWDTYVYQMNHWRKTPRGMLLKRVKSKYRSSYRHTRHTYYGKK